MQKQESPLLRGLAAVLLALALPASASAWQAPKSSDRLPARLRSLHVSLTFDDSHAGHRWAAEALSRRGMVGTFYVNSPRIGVEGYLRLEDLLQMEASGHEIGGHTLHHPALGNLDEAAQLREICDDRAALLSLGVSPRSFAYPFNSYAPSTLVAAERCGYVSARAAAGLTGPGTCPTCPRAESLPPRDGFRIRSFPSYQEWMGVEALQEAIEEARDVGGWLIFVFHDFCDDSDRASSYSIPRAEFLRLLDWMQAENVRTSTVSEVVPGPLRPAVLGPPVRLPPRVGSNLLRNPGLSRDDDENGIPDCWMEGGYGDRSGSLAYIREDGLNYARLEVYEIETGDHKFLSARGPCAPRVAGGQRFRATVRHRTEGHARLVAYYQDEGGAWRWWANSPPLPEGSDWSWSHWETKPLPDGAKAVQLGLSLRSKGTVDARFFSLEEVEPEDPPASCGASPLGWVLAGLAGRRFGQWGRSRLVSRSPSEARSVEGVTSTGR